MRIMTVIFAGSRS